MYDEIEKTGNVSEKKETIPEEYLTGTEELQDADEADDNIGAVENEKTQKRSDAGSLAASVLGGLLGAFAALLIISVCCAVSGGIRYFPYILIPLCVCFATVILKGNKGTWGFVISAVFSAVGMFFVPAFAAAVEYAGKQGISALSVPLIAFSKVGEVNFFTDISFSSASVFPIVFVVIGLAVVWQIFRYYRIKQN